MEEKIDITIQARYFTHGNPDANNLIIALHGYGQLASYFIKKFEFLNPETYFVVAPEGLHRFYINGTSGRVGASWMTKENRENDIHNYLHFLKSVTEKISDKKIYKKRVLLGFSQGGATASRFLGMTLQSFDAFLLWASVFPPDMNRESLVNFNSSKNYLVIGNQDPYYSEEDIVIEQEKLNKGGTKFEYVKFDGNHTIHAQTLQQILNEI